MEFDLPVPLRLFQGSLSVLWSHHHRRVCFDSQEYFAAYPARQDFENIQVFQGDMILTLVSFWGSRGLLPKSNADGQTRPVYAY